MQPLICWVFFGDTPGLLGARAHRDIIPFFLVLKAHLRARILVTSAAQCRRRWRRVPRSREGLHSEPQSGKSDTVKKEVGWGCSDKGSYSQGRNDSRLHVSCLILILFFNSLSVAVIFIVSSSDFCFVFGLYLTFIIIKIIFWGLICSRQGIG